MKTFNFEAYTPSRPFFSGQVRAVTLSLPDGEISVYADHAPFTAPVETCLLKLRDEEGKWKIAFISNGLIEVKHSRTVLLTEAAEWPSEIDRSRAEAAKKDATTVLQTPGLSFQTSSAKQRLKRAETRLKALGAC
jgi:F-type H+-transporting ATPase subunit epsilon